MIENPTLMIRKAKAVKAHAEGTSPTPPRGTLRNSHQGIERFVYIDKRNGWVFKVERPRMAGCGTNKKEYDAYLRGKDLPLFNGDSKFRLPVTTMVEDVIVQEYIKGRMPGYDEWDKLNYKYAIETALKIGDVHYQNVIEAEAGKFWFVVDMSFSRV